MKTAMQELIDRLKQLSEDRNADNIVIKNYMEKQSDIINEQLEKEKSQLKRAYKDCHDYFHRYGLDAEKYFNENFEQNK